jgi:hypothetical protein
MKAFKIKLFSTFFITGWILAIVGCENEIEQPLWDKGFKDSPTPVITAVSPIAALPGINKITITGNSFAEADSDNQVYFENIKAEIVEGSTTSLTVLRPNIIGDSTTIKVLCKGAIVVANYSHYKVTSVMDKFVSSALQMDAIEIDRNENLYFIERSALEIFKVTPGGSKTKIGTARFTVSDMKFAPSGKLLLISQSSNVIDQVDITTGDRTPWVYLNTRLGFCDFDANGNFYAGGVNRVLYAVSPDTSKKTISDYGTENILSLRVYNGYVYVLTARSVIWRNQILNANGNLGSKEKVLDLSGTGFPSSPQRFTFSASGLLYIASSDTLQRTLVTYDLNKGQSEPVYKGIIPNSPPVRLVWGTGNLLYLLTGSGLNWDILRIDIGTTGAPYYGR